MHIPRNIANFFRRSDRRDTERNRAQAPAAQAPATATATPQAALRPAATTQPIAIAGARPPSLQVPPAAHIRDRSPSPWSMQPPPSQGSQGTPPPVYHSRAVTPNSQQGSLLAPPALSESPAPSFNRSLRDGETRLARADFGDPLGLAPTQTGNMHPFNMNLGSMAALYPGSERGDAEIAGSAGSSLQAHGGHDRNSIGGSDSSSPIFAGFFAEMDRRDEELRASAPQPPRPPDGASGSPAA